MLYLISKKIIQKENIIFQINLWLFIMERSVSWISWDGEKKSEILDLKKKNKFKL